MQDLFTTLLNVLEDGLLIVEVIEVLYTEAKRTQKGFCWYKKRKEVPLYLCEVIVREQSGILIYKWPGLKVSRLLRTI